MKMMLIIIKWINFSQRGVEILDEIINRPEFRHWEIDDAHPRLNFELDVYDEQPEISMWIINVFNLLIFKWI